MGSLWHSDFDSGFAICLHQSSGKSIFGHIGQEEVLVLGLHPLNLSLELLVAI